jgi:hypothetical protein
MSTLYLSSYAANNMIENQNTGLVTSAFGSFPQSLISGGNNAGTTLLLIYKGTPATFPDLADRSTRASDLLLTFSLPFGTGSFQNLGYVGTTLQYVIGKGQPLSNAAASGTATWFILCRAGTTSLTDKGAMIGTVGDLNSSEDLKIGNVSIVSGQSYQATGIIVSLPQVWDV